MLRHVNANASVSTTSRDHAVGTKSGKHIFRKKRNTLSSWLTACVNKRVWRNFTARELNITSRNLVGAPGQTQPLVIPGARFQNVQLEILGQFRVDQAH